MIAASRKRATTAKTADRTNNIREPTGGLAFLPDKRMGGLGGRCAVVSCLAAGCCGVGRLGYFVQGRGSGLVAESLGCEEFPLKGGLARALLERVFG